jgi:prepilin-type N-terminal cleavage/methylation domain-containing protein
MKCIATGRRGFTVLETLAALAILAVAMVLAAQAGVWSLMERSRNATRYEVLEAANNILEAGRARSWSELTPDWAAEQRLPQLLAERLHKAQLHVRVEPEASRPHCKRVTVEIRWTLDQGQPARPVRLVAVFGVRSAAATGGKP